MLVAEKSVVLPCVGKETFGDAAWKTTFGFRDANRLVTGAGDVMLRM